MNENKAARITWVGVYVERNKWNAGQAKARKAKKLPHFFCLLFLYFIFNA